MKRILLFTLLIFSLGTFCAKAGGDTDITSIANTLYIESLTTDAGAEVTLSLKMKNSLAFVGFQCDVLLPNGMTFQADEDGFSFAELSTARTTSRKTDYFNSSFPNQDLQKIRILCSSSKKYEFSGNDGEVAIIPMVVSGSMAGGTYPITISNIVLTDAMGKTVEAADVQFSITVNGAEDPAKYDLNGDGKVDITDVTKLVNYILKKPNSSVFQADGLVHGIIPNELVEIPQGYIWGEIGPVTVKNAFATSHRLYEPLLKYDQAVFNGKDIVNAKIGIQGGDNPKDSEFENPGISLKKPTSGAIVQIETVKDGYVFLLAWLATYKQYYVFEDDFPIGFTLAMEAQSNFFPSGMISYVAQGEGMSNIITDPEWTDWPENVYYNKILGQEKTEDIKLRGLGVIGFPVHVGHTYLIGGGGSKLIWYGVCYTDKPCSVVLHCTDLENTTSDFVLLSNNYSM